MDRVLTSVTFQRSPRQREFLAYICDRTLKGRAEEVTETEIGRMVFGRPRDYSPGDDNIVRVAARQLRTKLKEHFDGEGRNEPLTIEIPKGSYVPVFVSRECPLAEWRPPNPAGWWTKPIYGVLAVVAAVCMWLSWDNLRLRESRTV